MQSAARRRMGTKSIMPCPREESIGVESHVESANERCPLRWCAKSSQCNEPVPICRPRIRTSSIPRYLGKVGRQDG